MLKNETMFIKKKQFNNYVERSLRKYDVDRSMASVSSTSYMQSMYRSIYTQPGYTQGKDIVAAKRTNEKDGRFKES